MAEPGEPLSNREQDVVRLVATGATNRMIAQQLSISPNTVKVHLRNIFAKLEINSRTEATVIAIREGWVEMADGRSGPGGLVSPAETVVADPSLDEIDLDWSALAPGISWAKRLYLLVSVAMVVLLAVFTRPRSYLPPAESCSNEFTSDCIVESNSLDLGEPESLWVSGAPMPEPRGRFALVAFQGELFAMGGEVPDGVTGDTLIYDLDGDAWRSAAEKPTRVANLAAVALGDVIYALGGSDEAGAPVDAVEIYDPDSNTWTAGVSLPEALVAHGAATDGERIYIFGGYDGTSYVSNVYAYDPLAGRWDTLADMPTPRGFAGVALLRGSVYVLGGYDGQREYAVCERLDLQSGRWDLCEPMTTPRGGVRAAAVAGQIFVVGGGWESFVTFSERYSPSSDTWHNVETPLLLTGGEWLNPGVTALGTRIFAMGGWQRDHYLNLNQAYEALPNRLYLPATTGGGS